MHDCRNGNGHSRMAEDKAPFTDIGRYVFIFKLHVNGDSLGRGGGFPIPKIVDSACYNAVQQRDFEGSAFHGFRG